MLDLSRIVFMVVFVNPPVWLSIESACKRADISRSTLLRLIKRGVLVDYRGVTGMRRVRLDELERAFKPVTK